MNLKKSFLTPLIGLAMIACTDKKEDGNNSRVEGIPTYVNFSITLPARTVPGKALPNDYNYDGTYEGNDLIRTLDIYMSSADGTIEAKRFLVTDLSTDGNVLTPSQPFRTTSGTKNIYIVVNDPDPLDNSIIEAGELVTIDNLADRVTQNGVDYDVITMTGFETGIYIEPDVPIQDVIGGTNNVAVEVMRLASRVIVTTTAPTTLNDETNNITGTLSNITYSVAQGTDQIYWLPQDNYESYAYDYVPGLTNYYGVADQYYDYSDLSTPTTVPARPVAGDGYMSLPGKFLFENTHAEGDIATTDYRKGNTAYVLVRAIFTPDPESIADGGTLTNGTFYVGISDGNIYSTRQNALDAVQNQRVAVYQGGKMLYYAWVNPDDIQSPLNSPVVRNNIYHINITGFSRIGYNWNPIYPEDPDTATPSNPDPKPSNPSEPDAPISPSEPLTPEQTFMSVEVSVLDWTVHSYDIEF